ncbi:DegQ family serine endoprotease [Propylenella binzhouense]|uniref:DegQ family serine endoprotease n=1 Tax=Propylenella binzhouense TaxID=2555902 RepID=A0A964T5Q1_9HYPH|nr:DegQ family serine endoprotease [Propylenella binzhouense]MYZ48900.1 DegQ family serine endoprotease [Propylenella binzhouense]
MKSGWHLVRAAAVAAALCAAAAAHAQGERVPADRQQIELSFAPVVKRVAPAVVNVYATERVQIRSPFEGDPFFERFFGSNDPFGRGRERSRQALGSGVVVGPDGLIVTNHHVIDNATEVKVSSADGREFPAEILLSDERTDLAVLRAEGAGDSFPVLAFADSDALEVGDLVLAIGNPFGVGQTVTSGIVSAVARTEIGISDMSFFIQTDAAINPGNSGGALVDMKGRVVGINTAIFSRSGGSLGIGFAIPSNMVKTVVAQALAGGKEVVRPWVGAVYQTVTPDIARSLDLDRARGALVTRVEKDSPAAGAGLKVGDLVTAVDGREVANAGALEYRLAITKLDSDVTFTIVRDGEERAVKVHLARPPESGPPVEIGGRGPLSGAKVADLSPALAERLRILPGTEGVAVVEVEPGSAAARLGLEPGDVVVQAQGNAVSRAADLKAISEIPSRIWRLSVDRHGHVSNLMIGG